MRSFSMFKKMPRLTGITCRALCGFLFLMMCWHATVYDRKKTQEGRKKETLTTFKVKYQTLKIETGDAAKQAAQQDMRKGLRWW